MGARFRKPCRNETKTIRIWDKAKKSERQKQSEQPETHDAKKSRRGNDTGSSLSPVCWSLTTCSGSCPISLSFCGGKIGKKCRWQCAQDMALGNCKKSDSYEWSLLRMRNSVKNTHEQGRQWLGLRSKACILCEKIRASTGCKMKKRCVAINVIREYEPLGWNRRRKRRRRWFRVLCLRGRWNPLGERDPGEMQKHWKIFANCWSAGGFKTGRLHMRAKQFGSKMLPWWAWGRKCEKYGELIPIIAHWVILKLDNSTGGKTSSVTKCFPARFCRLG